MRVLALGCCAGFGKAFCISRKELSRSVIPWVPGENFTEEKVGQGWFLRVGAPELRQEGRAERVGWEGMAFWMHELV